MSSVLPTRSPASGALLEREVELAALVELFVSAVGGRGGVIVVEGSPGVGKSALLGCAVREARERGLMVLRARGHELESAFGWGIARSLLEATLAALPAGERDELLGGPAGPARVRAAPLPPRRYW